MKCLIIYFSQTGNTEKIAGAIQAGVKKAAGNCDIIRMQDANPRRLYDYDLIGLGSPVIGLVPGNVDIFIKNMSFLGGKHIFSFCTHGTHPELYYPDIVRKLNKRGLVVIGTRGWYGAVYISAMPQPYPTNGHPDEIDLKEAESYGSEMVELSQKIHAGHKELIPPELPWPDNVTKEDLDPSALERTFKSMVKFHKEKCLYPKCRLCMDNCPMYGIDLSQEPPVIAKPCIDCEFCARICPTGAIDEDVFNELMEPFTTSHTDFILSPLRAAQAKGEFRPLVDMDKLGTAPPLYKAHKHPIWIIGKGLQ